MSRLTIKNGELAFYEPVYTKCSNADDPKIKSQIDKGIPYYDIKDYKSKEYTDSELIDIYNKLGKLEDILEKYGIESVEELDTILSPYFQNGEIEYSRSLLYQQEQTRKAEQDRYTWKKACELACRDGVDCDQCPLLDEKECPNYKEGGYECTQNIIDYFYQQAQKEISND